MAEQYPVGVLLDATGNPMRDYARVGAFQQPAAPPGAYLPSGGYSATTIIVQPDGGRVELTPRNAHGHSMPYADVYSSQAPIAAVVSKMLRRLTILPRKVYQWPVGNRVVSMPKVGTRPPRTRRAFPEEVGDPDNGLVSLLEWPGPGYGHVSLKEWQYLSLLVNGGSLLAKYRGNGPSEPPTQMLPLDWRFLQAWSRIGQPVIVWATVQTGQLKWINTSEVLFTAWSTVSGANGAWLCTSPLQQLGVTIKIDEAAQRYAAAHFKNAARPSTLITLPPEVDVRKAPELAARIEERIQESYGGVDEAFRAMVVGGGADAKPWGANAEEAQLVQTREQDFREVCAVYDMPFDAMFGQGAASAESGSEVWKALIPWAHLGDERFNAQVVHCEPEWRSQRLFVKTDFNEVLYGDPLVLSDKMCAEVTVGLRSINEGRVPLGLEPRDDPAADELIYRVPGAGLVGDLPGQLSEAVEEREMVMVQPAPGEEPPLESLPAELGANE